MNFFFQTLLFYHFLYKFAFIFQDLKQRRLIEPHMLSWPSTALSRQMNITRENRNISKICSFSPWRAWVWWTRWCILLLSWPEDGYGRLPGGMSAWESPRQQEIFISSLSSLLLSHNTPSTAHTFWSLRLKWSKLLWPAVMKCWAINNIKVLQLIINVEININIKPPTDGGPLYSVHLDQYKSFNNHQSGVIMHSNHVKWSDDVWQFTS